MKTDDRFSPYLKPLKFGICWVHDNHDRATRCTECWLNSLWKWNSYAVKLYPILKADATWSVVKRHWIIRKLRKTLSALQEVEFYSTCKVKLIVIFIRLIAWSSFYLPQKSQQDKIHLQKTLISFQCFRFSL